METGNRPAAYTGGRASVQPPVENLLSFHRLFFSFCVIYQFNHAMEDNAPW